MAVQNESVLGIFTVIREGELGYDEYIGYVVVAVNEKAARQLAKKAADKSAADSYSPRYWPSGTSDVTCEEVGTALIGSKPGVIFSSFLAG